MFWRTEHTAPMKGKDRRWWAPAFVALLGAMACSGEELIATITRDPDVPEKCEITPHEALDMGLDLYFVLEHSRENMQEWGTLARALGAQFNITEFAGMGAGFMDYPRPAPIPQTCVDNCGAAVSCSCLRSNCDCWDPWFDPALGFCTCRQWPPTSCNEADYTPSFEISRSSESPGGFFSALLTTTFDVPTFEEKPALYPALLASVRDRNDWEARHRGRRITQVLVATSLDFAEWCDEDRLSDVEWALSGADKPKTYVIAVNASDSDDDEFETLAAAGRAGSLFQIEINARTSLPTITGNVTDIIRDIRDNEGRCEYLVPAPPGTNPDPKKVNLTASSGGLLYKKVANRAACGSYDLGWYYESDDNPDVGPDQPMRIIACDGACKSLHGLQSQDAGPRSGSATAKIQLGCPTVYAGDAGR